MKSRSLLFAGLAFVGVLAPAFGAQKVTADILPPQRREATVDIAAKLTQRPVPKALSPEMPNPFNPAGFDEPEANAGKGTSAAGGVTSGTTTPGASAQPPRPAGDRDILETLAARLTPSGTFVLGGKPLLIIDRNRFEVGTKFIVTYNEQDYELELVAINRTTFTLRYRGEEITRPIKPVK